MQWYWFLFGFIEVLGFFYFSVKLIREWGKYSVKYFESLVFRTSLLLRLVAVFFLYWFFDLMTGKPFMFSAADSVEYHETALWFVSLMQSDLFWEIGFKQTVLSDFGYPFWLAVQYWFTDGNLIVARIIKAFLGAYTCVLVCRVAARNFGEKVGRMSAVFCMLMPNLIYYCGTHLKETEMVFLLVFFVERCDNMLRSNVFSFKNIVVPVLIGGVLFTFRTVIGMAAIGSMFLAIMLTSKNVISNGKKIFVFVICMLVITPFLGGRVVDEVKILWTNKDTNQEMRLKERAARGNDLVKYAGVAVFAPMILTLPYPTMVETEKQESMRLIHGGLVVKNIMSFFCIMSIFLLIYKNEWRYNVFLMSVLLSYLVVICFSSFAHAERFHLPMLPLEMIFAAVGVECMTNNRKRYYNMWCLLMVFVWIIWTYLKLMGRRML